MGVYLTKPNKEKENGNGEANGLRFAFSSMQGWRSNMEDAHIAQADIVEGVHLFAVFDGHGGAEVAKYCGSHFVTELKQNKNFLDKKYKEALEETFLKMDELLITPEGEKAIKQLKKDSEMKSYAGCTANVCLVTATEIYCANAGDSRAVVFEGGEMVSLSSDHKPDHEKELARIKAAGGYVSEGRVNDNLNLSRAIGDFEYKRNSSLDAKKQIITAFPDVMVYARTKKLKFLLMGCDGIWETKTGKEICEILDAKMTDSAKLSDLLDDLLDKLLAPDTSEGTGCDNMTSVLVQFTESLPTGKD